MSNITTESIIQDAMFALGMNTSMFVGTNKQQYINSFTLMKRLLIADKKLAATLILDQPLNTVLNPKEVGNEKNWYYQPSNLCQFFSVPTAECMVTKQPSLGSVVEYVKAIQVPSGKLSYYGDTDYYEVLPSSFVTLLSWKTKESLALQMADSKSGLLSYIMQKVKETEVELNKAKASEQNIKGSRTNIVFKSFKDIPIAV
jgi:hypothetical protein